MNLKTTIKTVALVVMTALSLNSCKKDPGNSPADPSSGSPVLALENEQVEGPIELGLQLPNPYTVENMAQAFENIQSSFPGIQSPVRNTHNYIKINVQDEIQLSTLKQDEQLIFYPYPMDYEIITNGTYYRHEEGQCDSCVTAQFSTVKVNHPLPADIATTVLATLYIPEEDLQLQSYIGSYDLDAFEEALVGEAFSLVGLSVETTPGINVMRTTGSKWRPAGKIRVWDNVVNTFVAIEGVEVRARRWFTTHRGLTNINGDYSCDGQFKHDANYSLQWDRHHFSIRSGTFGQAWYNGPKKRGNWNLDINSNPQMFYARIFRAAHQYYYLNIDGLNRPPLNNFWRPQLKIAAYNQDNNDNNGNAAPARRFLGLGNFIKLYNPNRDISAIHGTTIHELGHAAHWEICSPKSNFNDADDIVVESWARGVQYWLTRKYYPSYVPSYTSTYTGVVQDMIDGISGSDQVSGYTIAQIEQAVKNKKTWHAWRDNVKNLYTNATEANLDALYDFWD